jgi:hypothetical protein
MKGRQGLDKASDPFMVMGRQGVFEVLVLLASREAEDIHITIPHLNFNRMDIYHDYLCVVWMVGNQYAKWRYC